MRTSSWISPLLLSFAASAPANADIRLPLKPGIYVTAESGCKSVGSAAEWTYDGRNMAGHYQVCRTTRIDGRPGFIRNRCMERQGPALTKARLAEIEQDSDRTQSDMTLKIESTTRFRLNGEAYNFCAPWSGPPRR